MDKASDYLPALKWMRSYSGDDLKADMVAGLVVTMMLIPQSLAYALLAGVPAEVGLYASILPLIAYSLFGSSRTLSVGPVAVVSLMTMVRGNSINFVALAIGARVTASTNCKS